MNNVEQVLGVLTFLFLGTFIIGFPLSSFILSGKQSLSRFRQSVYLAPAFGFSLLCFVSMLINFLFDLGTDYFARPLFIGMVALSSVCIYLTEGSRKSPFSKTIPIALVGFIISLIATRSVLIPVLSGDWSMAYATGDDAARWYMSISYFMKHSIELKLQMADTLNLVIRERFMYFVVGSTISTVFGVSSALSYSIMSAFGLMLSALAIMAFIDPIFPKISSRLRLTMGLLVSVLFAFYPPALHMYYQGYHTHHFSLFVVLTTLCFFSAGAGRWNKTAWYGFWSLILAAVYTYRYVVLVAFVAGLSSLLRAYFKKSHFDFKTGLGILRPIVAGALLATVILSYEIWLMIQHIDPTEMSYNILTLQKSSLYYWGQLNVLESIFKGFGMLSPWQSIDTFSPLFKAAATGYIALCILLPLALTLSGKSIELSVVLFSNFIVFMILFLSNQTYVLFKMLLYWPILLEAGILVGCLFLLQSKNYWKKGISLLLLIFIFSVKIAVENKNQNFYFALIEARKLKVDESSKKTVNGIKNYFNQCQDCKNRVIFGHVIGEYHLFGRELLRDFQWQPIRGQGLTYEGDLIKKIDYDKYDFEVLMVGKSQKCGPFDFSGNKSSHIQGNSNIDFYSRKSSLVEFQSGIRLANFGTYDVKRHCQPVGGLIDKDGALLFVNNGQHSELSVNFYYPGKAEDFDKIDLFFDQNAVSRNNSAFTKVGENTFQLKIENLGSEQIRKLSFKNVSLKHPLIISKVSWK